METLPYNATSSKLVSDKVNEGVYGAAIVTEVQHDFGVQKVPVYIYNISQQEFNFPRPPNHPHWLVRACPKGEPWFLTGSENHPFSEEHKDTNGHSHFKLTDGRAEVQKMINPSNMSLDQDFAVQDGLHINGNLNEYGVFWSMHYPPLESEVAAAKRRMEKTYRKRLEFMSSVEAKNPTEAQAVATITDHCAADYFGVSTSWHRTDLVPKTYGNVECKECGEDIKASARSCRFCGAPTDDTERETWREAKFTPKRGPGRPPHAA